jgi:hypothetical protein
MALDSEFSMALAEFGLIFWREMRRYTAVAQMSDIMALECISVN